MLQAHDITITFRVNYETETTDPDQIKQELVDWLRQALILADPPVGTTYLIEKTNVQKKDKKNPRKMKLPRIKTH